MAFYEGIINMRISTVTAFILCMVCQLCAQSHEIRHNPGLSCGDQSKGLPDSYYEAVLAHIKPPGYQRWLVSLTLNGEVKIILAMTADKFELWTDVLNLPQGNINKFLLELDQSCRLPADPADAAALINVKWESKELSPTQFSQFHHEFTEAASSYLSKAQEIYGSLAANRSRTIYLDSSYLWIFYENQEQHIELQVLRTADGEKATDPMLRWGYRVSKLAEESFRQPFGRKSGN